MCMIEARVPCPSMRRGSKGRSNELASTPEGKPTRPQTPRRRGEINSRKLLNQSLREDPMEARLDYAKLAPDAMRALYSLGAYLAKCGLEHPLLELVKIRASQINGCAY